MNLLELLGLSVANAMPFTATEKKARQNVEKLKGCDWFNQLYENEMYNELSNHSEVIKVIWRVWKQRKSCRIKKLKRDLISC